MRKTRDLFVKNLKHFMGKRNLTQKEFANLLKVSQPTLIPILKAESAPTIDKLERFAEALNIAPYELLLPDQPRETPTVSSLSKMIESQASLLEGNEELLELWKKLDEVDKDMMMTQMKMLIENESDKKTLKKNS